MWRYVRYSDELYHHGIMGMKWGVRRYQNEDGSLTPAGKRRHEKLVARSDKAIKRAIQLKSRNPITRKYARNKEKLRRAGDVALGAGLSAILGGGVALGNNLLGGKHHYNVLGTAGLSAAASTLLGAMSSRKFSYADEADGRAYARTTDVINFEKKTGIWNTPLSAANAKKKHKR